MSITTVPAGRQPPSTTPSVSAPKDRSALGKDDFLQLLVTQLKNQDPANTVQPDQFAAELAQYSSVEQLIQLNSAVAAQTAASSDASVAQQASLGASLLGRQVVASSDLLAVSSAGTATGLVDVGTPGGPATLVLTDDSGKTVATRDIGTLPGGRQRIDLDGLPGGTWHYAVKVAGSSGTTIPVTTYAAGTVNGLTLDTGKPQLLINGLEVPVSNLVEVLPPASTTTTE